MGDINVDLINTYCQVRDDFGAVSDCLDMYPVSSRQYYLLRELEPSNLPLYARAARFIYLNRLCFNGLYRTNSKGHFNVPYGGKKVGRFPSREELASCSRALRKTALHGGDFEGVMREIRPDDLVYLDPPFSVRNRRIFREYDPATFGITDLARLRSWMDAIAGFGAHFIVSYADSPESEALSNGYHSIRVKTTRNIAGFVASRHKVTETIISNSPLD